MNTTIPSTGPMADTHEFLGRQVACPFPQVENPDALNAAMLDFPR